jgi:hypothetical protein
MSEDLQQQTTEVPGGEQPVAEAAAQAPAAPELTIQDLNNLRTIIDVATQRGAWRAPELAAVGSAFNRLNDFLNAVAPQQPAEAPAEETAPAETPAENLAV